MRSNFRIAMVLFAGVAIGAIAVQGLHAQATPPVYLISEIEISNLDAYVKDYAPLAQKSIKDAGGRFVAVGPGQAVPLMPQQESIASTPVIAAVALSTPGYTRTTVRFPRTSGTISALALISGIWVLRL